MKAQNQWFPKNRQLHMLLLMPLIFLAPGLIAGCETAGDTTVSGAKPAAVVTVPQKDKYVIGFSQCTVVEPWRVQMNRDVQEAADRHDNLELRIAVAEDAIDRQVSDVQNFISLGVDFIIISPKETAASLTGAVANAYRRGIPVIVLDRQLIGDEFTTFIGADNHKIGYEAGKFIRQSLNGQGNIVELKGNMATVPGQLRSRGFRDAIAEELRTGAIRIIHEADIDWKQDRAQTEMESVLAAHPQIDLVYGHNDPAARGAHTAARQAGRDQAIKFVGVDALPHEGVAYVQEGVLDATLEYPTGGAEAIQTILDMIAGEEIPRNIKLGTRLFTRENVAGGGEPIN